MAIILATSSVRVQTGSSDGGARRRSATPAAQQRAEPLLRSISRSRDMRSVSGTHSRRLKRRPQTKSCIVPWAKDLLSVTEREGAAGARPWLVVQGVLYLLPRLRYTQERIGTAQSPSISLDSNAGLSFGNMSASASSPTIRCLLLGSSRVVIDVTRNIACVRSTLWAVRAALASRRFSAASDRLNSRPETKLITTPELAVTMPGSAYPSSVRWTPYMTSDTPLTTARIERLKYAICCRCALFCSCA